MPPTAFVPAGLKRTLLYAQQSCQLGLRHPGKSTWRALAGYFPAWYRSLNPAFDLLEAALPWLPFPVTGYLEGFLKPHMRVFEYGCGGSTLFFAQRVQEVQAVEHDPAWHRRTRDAIHARGFENCSLRLFEPAPRHSAGPADPGDPDAYASDEPGHRDHSFRDYAASISAFPDGYFDLIVIDGRARPACFAHAAHKVRPEGRILWDNSCRAYYRPVIQAARAEFTELVLRGPTPGLVLFDQCSVLVPRNGRG